MQDSKEVVRLGVRERFPETSWTLLARARKQTDEGARAREDFAHKYYRPVQEFLLVLVQDSEQAQELAQDFFSRLSVPGGLLERAHPEKGALRDYLQQTLRNLVIDYHRSNRKRAHETHPDQASAGAWEVMEPAGFPAAEAAFHHAWVKVTLAEALSRVRTLCLKRKQDVHLDLFEARYISEAHPPPSWEELGARYGLDQKAARDRADTVARHFRLVLRRMLRNEITVPGGSRRVTEAAIDEEIRALLSPLRD
jgi:DNA-directed RNA polymerase specialized sigma24 family protein